MAFTSIKTTGGWADNAVATTAYDLIFGWELKASSLCYQLVDVSPKQVPHRGASVTMELNNFFGESEITAGLTPLDEETDVTPSQLPATRKVTLTPKEYGRAVTRTLKLNNRGLVAIDPVIGKAVAEAGRDTIDRLVQTTMRSTANKIYGGTATSTATVAAGSTASAAKVREAVTRLRGKSVSPKDGQFYVGVFHPDVIHDLRVETGSGSWRVPNEYGASQSQIWNGEFAEFEGVRFISNNRVLWGTDANTGSGSTVDVYHSFIMGAEALAKAEITPLKSVISPTVDKLQRFSGLGWYADLDFALYRPEAIYELQTSSSLANNAS